MHDPLQLPPYITNYTLKTGRKCGTCTTRELFLLEVPKMPLKKKLKKKDKNEGVA
jgi:hypothetical protein